MLLRGEGTSHILPFLWMKGEDNETIGGELDRIEECGIREGFLRSGLVGEPGLYLCRSKEERDAAVDSGR